MGDRVVCLTYVCVRLGHDAHTTRKEKFSWRGGGGAGGVGGLRASPGKAGAAGGMGSCSFHREGAARGDGLQTDTIYKNGSHAIAPLANSCLIP